MRKSLRTLAFACLTVLTIGSCKKNSDANGGLVGSWTLSEYGADVNKNNTVDAGETGPIAGSGITSSITFNSNNTYSSVSNYGTGSQTESGTYTLSNNVLTTTHSGVADVVRVNTLTNNSLVIKDESSDPATWGVFTK